MNKNRRIFLKNIGQVAATVGLSSTIIPIVSSCGKTSNESANNQESKAGNEPATTASTDLFFKISLAQWSLHKALFNGDLDNLDFAAKAKNDFGIEAVEYVNGFFKDKAEDQAYLADMKKRADDLGVQSLLIMIDGEGNLGSTDEKERVKAVENHYKWVEAAQFLGCHSIRVNAAGKGTAEEVSSAAISSLGKLTEFAKDFNINVIVENHGGYSSNGTWLANVISQVGMDGCGTLPDFGNFCITRGENGCQDEYDRYQGITELMPFAKGVSAKSHDFDADGNEIHSDYYKILKIVKDAGYTGHIGVEYEGSKLSEDEGIKATKALLLKAGATLS
ncbi:sugar phosphate isomerase/epimerase family protein [Rapidithrix thailandica]|uniref:Sugar phosphate isomerase/epimerase family protein n=1 Tax=Rapidithrix thailandica TaxID=413964 RepID=A0AAW9RS74_9BACT